MYLNNNNAGTFICRSSVSGIDYFKSICSPNFCGYSSTAYSGQPPKVRVCPELYCDAMQCNETYSFVPGQCLVGKRNPVMVCESETLSGIQPPSPFDRPDQDCFQTIAGFILYTDAWSSNDQWFKMINWNRWCTSNSDTRIQV